MPPLLLTLDVGTTTIKVGLFSADGQLIRMASREQSLVFPAPGRVEQSPRVAWMLMAEATREAVAGSDLRMIGAISLANHRGTAIALDHDGLPLSEFIVWMDKRGLPWTDWLADRIGAADYYDACGHPIVSYTGITKLLWFQHEAPDVWVRSAVIGPPQTLFLKWLGCDELVCDRSTGTFLFPFDLDRQTWNTDLAARIGFPLDRLPRLVNATDLVGRLSAVAADHLGLPAGIPLIAGGGDGQCAAVGSGVVQSGRVMVNIGTGAGVQAYLSAPLRDPGRTLNCAVHVVGGAWEIEGHTQSSGAAFRWLRDLFGSGTRNDAYDRMIEAINGISVGADGLLFLPTFNGSSAPVVDLEARGALLGLSLEHGRDHIVRALLEGISLELRWMLDAMTDLGLTVDEVRLAGGGSRNPRWNQIHAGILDQPVRVLVTTEASMVGAGMCAAVGMGTLNWSDASERFVHVGSTVEPVVEDRAAYADLYQNYREIFLLLSREGVFRRLRPQP